MLTNTDITLYNKFFDKADKCIKYKRSYLKGVNYRVRDSVSVSGKGVSAKNEVVIYIPFSIYAGEKKYLKPKKYEVLDELEKENYFTLNNGDIVVNGIIDFELTGEKTNNFKTLNEIYDDVSVISTVITYDCGSDYMKHWKVVCN